MSINDCVWKVYLVTGARAGLPGCRTLGIYLALSLVYLKAFGVSETDQHMFFSGMSVFGWFTFFHGKFKKKKKKRDRAPKKPKFPLTLRRSDFVMWTFEGLCFVILPDWSFGGRRGVKPHHVSCHFSRAQARLQSEESRMHKKKFECQLLFSVLLVFDNLQELPVVKFFRGGYNYSNY